jgi:hypothetical protein
MYTGTGDENTDIGAHLMGFVCGFVGGMLLTKYREYLTDIRWQKRAAIATPAMLMLAWIAAFGG